jgi:hypothetical protein
MTVRTLVQRPIITHVQQAAVELTRQIIIVHQALLVRVELALRAIHAQPEATNVKPHVQEGRNKIVVTVQETATYSGNGLI